MSASSEDQVEEGPRLWNEPLEDITDEFLNACQQIPLGELVKAPNFQLSEAMSAIELMDPKMDSGVTPITHYPTVDEAVAMGFLDMPDDELIATVDATFACLCSYLEGGGIAQGLLTNILLTEPDAMSHLLGGPTPPVLPAISHAFAHLILLIRHTIQTASVFEEEDFNTVQPYVVPSSLKPEEVLLLLRNTEKALDSLGKSSPTRHASCVALCDRLRWLSSFLSALTHLVVPKVDDASFLNNHGSPSSPPFNFRPKLKQATEQLDIALSSIRNARESFELGKEAPNGDDSDFSWLRSFIPDLNRQFMPAQFPRKTEMISRRRGLEYLARLTQRMRHVAADVASVVGDVNSILLFLRQMCEGESCVLSRSVLQLVLLPNDERVLGEVQLADIVSDSVKRAVGPPFMFPNSPAAKNHVVQVLWTELVADCVRVFLSVIQTFGNNLARQRDKLQPVFEDLATLQFEAEKLDAEMTHCMANHLNVNGECKGPPPAPCTSTFVLQQSVNLVRWHFDLGFRLNLFVSYEYPYVYWYLRDIVCKWTMATVERSENMLMAAQRADQAQPKNKNQKTKPAKVLKMEEQLKKRHISLVNRLTFIYGEEMMLNGYLRVAVALIADGKTRVPSAQDGVEANRFEHRMHSFAIFGIPLHPSYDHYIRGSDVIGLIQNGPAKCYGDAAQYFELAREHLSKCPPSDVSSLLRLCRQNSVVLRILASGARPNARIEWEHDQFPLYPLLRLI